MRYLPRARTVLVGVLTTLLLTAAPMMVAHADKSTPGLAADHVIACIKTAVAAHAGLVKAVEVESEGTQWLCEVKLVDEAGKRHNLPVDVATNQVVKTR